MKALRDLAAAEHAALFESGKLWELYPEASGDFKADTMPMKLLELYNLLCTETRNEGYDLYYKHFAAAIEAEGFNPKQAAIISGEAYERGHSAGVSEIVCQAQSLVEFGRKLLAAK